MNSKFKLLILPGLLFLAGCPAYFAGHNADFSVVYHGKGELGDPVSTVRMIFEEQGIECDGVATMYYQPVGVIGGKARTTAKCTDGRTSTGETLITSFEGGTGFSTDNCGNKGTYFWSTNAEFIERKLSEFRATKKRLGNKWIDKCKQPKKPAAPPLIAKKSAPAPAPAKAGSSLEKQIATLQKFRQQGVISESEFQARKTALLDKSFGKVRSADSSGQTTTVAIPAPKAKNSQAIPANINFGDFHALVIGIDNYKFIGKLGTAVADARAMTKVLQDLYGYTVTQLINPTRSEIIDSLDEFRASLKFKDNLLIYYAGHGWLDEAGDEGYWLPVDAKPDRRSNWVSNAILTNTLRAMEAKHVMVLADSCYSGRLVRGVNVQLGSPDYYQKMARKKARVVITSGGLEPVADSDGTGHSPFTSAILKSLSDNSGVIDGNSLFNAIRRPVMVAADQTPQYSDVRKAGHDGGDFLFVRRK